MIAVNTVYQRIVTGEKFRILWINPSITYAYVIDVKDNPKMPYEMLIAELNRDLLLREVVRISEPLPVIVNDDINESKGWKIIRNIINMEPDIYIKTERYRLIEKLMQDFNISDVTIYSYLKRYWKGGMTPTALLDMRKVNSGVKGSQRQQSDKKIGPRTANGKGGMPITDEVKRQIKEILNKYYFNREEAELSFAYKMLINEYYSEQIQENDGTKVLQAKETRPSERQFYYWSKKLFNPTEKIIKKVGEKRYQKDYRGTDGSSKYEAPSPGSRFEIDSTPCDIYLVSEYDRTKIIGKPTLYLVVDVFSTLIAGFYAGSESSSSWFGGTQALINTVKDKVQLCKEFDIDITENEWPSKFFPKALLADKAEFIGYNSDLITENFKVRVENASSYRADMKGTVEMLLGLIPKYIRPFAPGYIEPDFEERGGRDYRLEAKLTIREFTSLIIECIRHYNKSIKNDYPLSKEMIVDNLVPTPNNLWNWGYKNNPSNLKHYDTELVYYHLLPRSTATVTQDGIKFKRALYTFSLAKDENWYSLARNNGSWKINISYDTRNTNYIYIHYEKGFIRCVLLPHQEAYKNSTYEDLDFLDQKLKKQKSEYQTTQLSNDITLISNIKGKTETFIAKAEEEIKGLPKTTKTERTSNIKENRDVEKEKERSRTIPNYDFKEQNETESNEPDSTEYNRKSIIELGLYKPTKEN